MLSFSLLMFSLLAIKHGLKDIKSWSKKRFSGSLFQIVAGCCPRECRKLLLLPITSIWTPSLFAFPFCKAPSEYKIDSISDVKSREITSTMLPLYNDLLNLLMNSPICEGLFRSRKTRKRMLRTGTLTIDFYIMLTDR